MFETFLYINGGVSHTPYLVLSLHHHHHHHLDFFCDVTLLGRAIILSFPPSFLSSLFPFSLLLSLVHRPKEPLPADIPGPNAYAPAIPRTTGGALVTSR